MHPKRGAQNDCYDRAPGIACPMPILPPRLTERLGQQGVIEAHPDGDALLASS